MSSAGVDRMLERRRCARRRQDGVRRRDRMAGFVVPVVVAGPAVAVRVGFWARVWAWVRRLWR